MTIIEKELLKSEIMQKTEIYFHDHNFDHSDSVQISEYENCTFKSCNLSERVFCEFKFIDCLFISCNLSLVNLKRAVFSDVKFKDCKMLGVRFDTYNESGLSLYLRLSL